LDHLIKKKFPDPFPSLFRVHGNIHQVDFTRKYPKTHIADESMGTLGDPELRKRISHLFPECRRRPGGREGNLLNTEDIGLE
jgi:hypothetical protein